MGKGKHCTRESRRLIIQLKNQNFSISHIARTLNCSRCMVRNAIRHFERYKSIEPKTRKNPPRKTSRKEDRIIARISKSDPFLTSRQIKHKMSSEYDVNISARTVRRRLADFSLRGCIAVKKPLVSTKNRKKR